MRYAVYLIIIAFKSLSTILAAKNLVSERFQEVSRDFAVSTTGTVGLTEH